MNAPNFTYSDGSEIQIGDSVLLENGRTPGIVDYIVLTSEEMKSTNVEEPGIMLKSPPFGLVYLTQSWLADDPLLLVSRAPKA